MDSETLQNYTMDYSAEYREGHYYIGSSLGIDRSSAAGAMSKYGVELAPGDWVIRTEPILYGYILGFEGTLDQYIGEMDGQSCFASYAEIEQWLATPMDNTAPELTCAYCSPSGHLRLAKNDVGQVVAFAFTQ